MRELGPGNRSQLKAGYSVGRGGGLAFGSTCKRFKVHDHSRDMIRLCFRESEGESLEKDKAEDWDTLVQ